MKQQITKGAIQASFLKILGEKPFGKITVRDIVEDCGLTRNTFYYYYEDVYDIVDELLLQSIEAEIDRLMDADKISLSEIFVSAVRSLESNRKLVHNLLRTSKIEELERYFDKAAEIMLNHCVDKLAGENTVDPSDRQLILDCCVFIFKGMTKRWIAGDMKYSLEDDIERMAYLFEGSVKNAIERAKKEK